MDRFKSVLSYFKSVSIYLGYFGIQEEDTMMQQGVVVFDFGLVLENQLAYYSGLFFKVVVSSSQNEDERHHTIGSIHEVNNQK